MNLTSNSMPSNSTPWSAEQREWLQAMGHDVLMLAPTGVPAVVVAADVEAQAPPARERNAPAAADHPLLRALARAAGRRDASELAALLPDPSALRGNAAAKRALWPQLRALRRPRPGT